MSPRLPEVLAHRGFSARAPENTLAAFRLAESAGADGIELDVHRCGSGEVVVIHDHRLGRTAGLDAAVESTSWERIRALDAGGWKGAEYVGERVPLFSEVLGAFGDRFRYDVEIKSVRGSAVGPLEDAVVEEIHRHGLAARCFVTSFNPLSVRRVERVGRGIPTGVLFANTPGMPFWLRRGQGRLVSGSRILAPHHSGVDARFVERFAHRRGYRIMAWTVDDPAEARRLAALGVHGIITNDPAGIRAALSA